MSKITITLDATKLRNLVTKREFNAKDGTQMQVQEVRFELVPVKEPKTIHEGSGYKLQKTHFASVIQTKEEREANAETVFIGEGITTIWEEKEKVFNAVRATEEDLNEPPF
ncbi:MAG TPA: hypothetical protein VJ780_06260 [Flavobacterium sp.]|nr:hypothetical protein [Flavobacterium sp.]